MPDTFYIRTKKMQWISISQLISGILLAVCCTIILDCLFSKGPYQTYLIFGIIAAVNLTILFFLNQYIKKERGSFPPYAVPVYVDTVQDVVRSLLAEIVDTDAYVSFCTVDGTKIRTLIQYTPEYDKSKIATQRKKANQVINRIFHVTHSVPIYEALSSMRINLVVCDCVNENLLKWVGQNTELLLSRNEAIVSVAIVLDEKKMYFPAFFGNVLWNQAKRYESAGVFLAGRLVIQ